MGESLHKRKGKNSLLTAVGGGGNRLGKRRLTRQKGILLNYFMTVCWDGRLEKKKRGGFWKKKDGPVRQPGFGQSRRNRRRSTLVIESVEEKKGKKSGISSGRGRGKKRGGSLD